MSGEQSVVSGSWVTPGGNPVTMLYRERTIDWNNISSCMTDDEYGLRTAPIGDWAIDIGAHVGGVTVALAVDNPDLQVIAIEPIPENLALLNWNLGANGVADRVYVWEGAVGATSVSYRFTGNDAAEQNAFVGNANGIPRDSETTIHPVQWTAGDLPFASFLKIDCEGGEWGFFADPSARRFPYIVGELHDIGLGFRDEFAALLPDHDLTWSGHDKGVCGFTAVRRV